MNKKLLLIIGIGLIGFGISATVSNLIISITAPVEDIPLWISVIRFLVTVSLHIAFVIVGIFLVRKARRS